MKSKKILLISSGILITNNLLPYNVLNEVYAKEISDVWSFENRNTNLDFKQYSIFSKETDRTAAYFLKPIVPMSFNVPEKVGDEPLEYLQVNLQRKGIQYVSFVDAINIKEISGGYREWLGYNYFMDYDEMVFSNNEIRKIYWNKSSEYKNNIIIRHHAFANNNIQNLDIPNKVNQIDHYAFYKNEISWIKGWENVNKIGMYAFYSNKLVSSLPNGYVFEIPKTLTDIEIGTFYDNELTYVEIPENILTVGDHAFAENKITGIYFANPNTVINQFALKAAYLNSSKLEPGYEIIVYGHGNTSTARSFAINNSYTYVNVDQYENAVFDAEESKSNEKINEAYKKVSEMEDGDLKTNYLKRLDEIGLSFEIEEYIINAEKTLIMNDYLIAKSKVGSIKSVTLRIPYERRLETILNSIEAKKYKEIQEKLEREKELLTLSEIENLTKDLSNLNQSQDVIDLINNLNLQKDNASFNSYKLANSYLEYTKNNQTLKNVLETQKYINQLEDGYKFKEQNEVLYTNEFLLDSNGNKIIDEELSYLKTNGIDFDLDADNNHILKDGLSSPLYKLDPMFGKNHLVDEEKGSKEYLQSELNKFDSLVYAKSSYDVAKKYMNEEKLEEALLLTFVLEDSAEKNLLLDKLSILENEIYNLSDAKKEINDLISKYSKSKKLDDYLLAKDQINSKFSNEELIDEFINKLDQEKIVIELNEILNNGNLYGLNNLSSSELVSKLSLLDEENDDYNSLFEKSQLLLNEYLEYDLEYETIISKIDSAKENANLSIEEFRELQNKVYKVKENNPRKNLLTDEINELYKDYLNNVDIKNKYDHLIEDINFKGTNLDSVSLEDIKTLKDEIKSLKNKKQREDLTLELDNLIEKVIKEYLIGELNASNENAKEIKENILKYNAYISDSETKKDIKELMNDKLYNILLEAVNINLTSPEILLSDDRSLGNTSILDKENILRLLDDVNKQGDILTLIDDKKIDLIEQINKKNDEGILDSKYLELLGNLYSSLNDFNKKKQSESVIQNIVNEYFEENYPNYYDNSGDYTINDYKDMSHLINHFDGIDFYDVSQDVIDNHIKNDISTVINSDDHRIWEGNVISQTIEDIGAIVNQNIRNDLENNLYTDFNDYLQNIDLSKTNSLETLTRLGDTINDIQNSDIKMDFIEGMTSYLEDNAQTIYDIAKQNNNQQAFVNFIEDYLSQDTIHKLIQNDNDNVVGKQTNDNKYYQDIINSLQGDVDKLAKALENLEKIMAAINSNGNSMIDSSNNTIGNEQGGFDFSNNSNSNTNLSNESIEKILGELGIDKTLEENNNIINNLKEEIIKLKEDNQEMLEENILSLKANSAGEDKNVKKQLEAYKDGNKSFNNMLLILGSSMWILILLGLLYLANLNLRNKKIINNLTETVEVLKEDNKKIFDKLEEIIKKDK